MTASMTKMLLAAALALAALAPAQAQPQATAQAASTAIGWAVIASPAAPPGFVAPALPERDDTNAERTITQPGNNAPVWRAVRESGTQAGSTTLPAAESGVLIQKMLPVPFSSRETTAGEAWRTFRNAWLIPYGGALLLIMLVAVLVYYFWKGPMGGHSTNTGRVIERFTPLERTLHWTTAATFSVLAISGIVLAFGKYILLPLFGLTLFGWLSYALKNLHNFVGPVFAVSLVLMAIVYLPDNFLKPWDWKWVKGAGGFLGGPEIPSHKYNFGEKVVYWAGAVVLGLLVVGSGLVLDKLIPGLGETRNQMQVAHVIHGVAAMLMMAIFIGHIYMGTLGMVGGLDAMKTGYVDEAWAREHHELWYDDVKAGKIAAVRSKSPPPLRPATPRP